MALISMAREGNQIIIHATGALCTTKRGLLHGELFLRIFKHYFNRLRQQCSPCLAALGLKGEDGDRHLLVSLLRVLADHPLEQAVGVMSTAAPFLEPSRRAALHDLVEDCYNYWRSFDRVMILHTESGPNQNGRRHRFFIDSFEELTHLVRTTYRDLCDNITRTPPRIYRQVAAGCNVGLIVVSQEARLPEPYRAAASQVPFVRQVWMDPPVIIDPPMNKRTGQFQRLERNPLEGWRPNPGQWVCYPARVGPLVIFVYVHHFFLNLGCALANLFELATDEQIEAGPDALYFFGVPPEALEEAAGELPTVFFDDEPNGLLVGAVPRQERFGYFGYLKKMVLTLHNIVMMKRGLMPYHGAMVRIVVKSGEAANVLLVGDTATGKSETLEACRLLGGDYLQELRVVADDMGSLEVREGRVLAYGTEIGAFVRLDDLQQGYAFGQIDRAIIMSPQRTNARVVLPVTTIKEVLRGHPVDFLLYANNYEQVDDNHPVVERFESAERALAVFREGAAMAKGTTTSTGLVHSYFANIFGPPQYREAHEALAQRLFEAAFEAGVFVGQVRTRLGIPGFEMKGPEEAAKALFALIAERVAS